MTPISSVPASSASASTSPDDVWVVVPAYNEAKRIAATIGELLAIYPNVIVVNDGSQDATAAEARRIAGNRAHVLSHAINCGQGAALQTGIEYAILCNAKYIVTFDGDGQHSVEDIARLLIPLRQGVADVVLGSRFLGQTHDMPRSRWLLLKLAVLFTRWFSWVKVTDTHNGLRAFTCEAAKTIHISLYRMAHATEIIDQIRANHLRFCEVPVNIRYSRETLLKGQSSWNSIRIAGQLILQKLLS